MTNYSFMLLDYPDATQTTLTNISDSGEVVGSYGNDSNYQQDFSETNGAFTNIDYPNTHYSTFPTGVNSNGDIVGGADVGTSAIGFLDKGGVVSQIKVPGAASTNASAINANGEIVGYFQTDATHAFTWMGGAITTFDAPYANVKSTFANGVNDAGVIVGDYITNNGVENSFIDDAGNFTNLIVPGAKSTVADGINNRGDVSGYYTLADGTIHGFVFSNASFSTIDVAGVDTIVSGINDAGQVVGYTQTSNGNRDGFIATPLCFAAGTAIRTTRGDVAVEALSVGDRVVTASGAPRPIRWLGHRAIDCRDAGAAKALPIRVVAHAFGPGLPVRDLFLSPGHPVLIGAEEDGAGGHLVPIMCLVNGTTVRRDAVDTVTYWHVELDAHDILLAEGLAAESYLDWGDRAFFTEGSDHALHDPDLVAPGLAGRCRPVAIDGPVVEAERGRLDAVFALRLAAMSGWPTETGWSLGF